MSSDSYALGMGVSGVVASWKPSEGVTEHNGQAFQGFEDFFAPPPDAIGEILTAHTTLQVGKEPKSFVLRFVIAATIAAVLSVGLFLTFHFAGAMNDRDMAIIAGVLFVFVTAITYLFLGFKHTVTYVGSRGIAKYVCHGSRENIRQETLFEFPSAAELRTSQTRQYVNGVYTGTSYDYTWTDANNLKVLKLKGTYQSKEGTPKAKDPFNWAGSAETAWSLYLLDLAQQTLDSQGAITFRLTGNDFVRVGPGFIELHKKGQPERLDVADVDELMLGEGVFTVKRVGASKGFLGIGKTGYFTFEYGKMANVRVFLMALDKLMGLRFG